MTSVYFATLALSRLQQFLNIHFSRAIVRGSNSFTALHAREKVLWDSVLWLTITSTAFHPHAGSARELSDFFFGG